jgi:hypothetical protein
MQIRVVAPFIDLRLGDKRSGPEEKKRSIGTPVPETARKSRAILDKFGYSFSFSLDLGTKL